MTADYEPGTVAALTLKSGALIGRAMKTSDQGWRVPKCGDFYYDREVADVRPLVVLDFDAASLGGRRVANVIDALRAKGTMACRGIADQIEAQTRPPKPAEPTGLGAVVEDARGQRWIRVAWPYPWCHANPVKRDEGVTHGSHRPWSEIDAVKVLSEGVTQ